MFIEEQYRRHGVGKMLFQEAKKLAKEKGVTKLKVEAAAQNEKVINFYHSCGFTDFDVTFQNELVIPRVEVSNFIVPELMRLYRMFSPELNRLNLAA